MVTKRKVVGLYDFVHANNIYIVVSLSLSVLTLCFRSFALYLWIHGEYWISCVKQPSIPFHLLLMVLLYYYYCSSVALRLPFFPLHQIGLCIFTIWHNRPRLTRQQHQTTNNQRKHKDKQSKLTKQIQRI